MEKKENKKKKKVKGCYANLSMSFSISHVHPKSNKLLFFFYFILFFFFFFNELKSFLKKKMKKPNTCYRHRPEIVMKRERDDFDYDRIEKVKG